MVTSDLDIINLIEKPSSSVLEIDQRPTTTVFRPTTTLQTQELLPP